MNEDKIEAPVASPTSEPTNGNSSLFGISIRGWLAVLAITTVCAMALMKITVEEPLYTLSVAIVAFYYGQNPKKA